MSQTGEQVGQVKPYRSFPRSVYFVDSRRWPCRTPRSTPGVRRHVADLHGVTRSRSGHRWVRSGSRPRRTARHRCSASPPPAAPPSPRRVDTAAGGSASPGAGGSVCAPGEWLLPTGGVRAPWSAAWYRSLETGCCQTNNNNNNCLNT